MTLADPSSQSPAVPPVPVRTAGRRRGGRGRDGAEALDRDLTVRLKAFEGREPQDVRINRAAPFGWWTAGVLALVAFMDRIEQSILAGALPSIKDEFGLSNLQAGALNTGAGVAGTLLIFVSARLASQVNRKRALGFVLLGWALLSFTSGIAVSFIMLLFVRIVLGAAGALNNPLGGSLLGDFYPRAGRGRAYGIERLAYYLANPVGVALGGVLASQFGWRAPFFFLVIPGLIVAMLCFLLREPVRGLADRIDAMKGGASAEAVAQDNADDAEKSLERFRLVDRQIWLDFVELLKIPTLRAVFISQFALLFGLGGLFFFTPTFLVEDRGLSEESAASIAGAVGGSGILLGFALGLWLGDLLQARIRGCRIALGACGLLFGAVWVLVYAAGLPLPATIAAYFLLNVGFSFSIPSITAATADLCRSSLRGQAFALYALIAGTSSSLAPLIIGFTADVSGSFGPAFAILAIPLFFASWVALRARQTYDADSQRSLDELGC